MEWEEVEKEEEGDANPMKQTPESWCGLWVREWIEWTRRMSWITRKNSQREGESLFESLSPEKESEKSEYPVIFRFLWTFREVWTLCEREKYTLALNQLICRPVHWSEVRSFPHLFLQDNNNSDAGQQAKRFLSFLLPSSPPYSTSSPPDPLCCVCPLRLHTVYAFHKLESDRSNSPRLSLSGYFSSQTAALRAGVFGCFVTLIVSPADQKEGRRRL